MKSRAALLIALFLASAAIPARADQKTDQLLKQVVAATQAVHALTSDITYSQTTGGKTVQKTGTIKLLKPNFLFEEVWPQSANGSAAQNGSTPHEILASDGQTYWEIAADGKLYKQQAADDGKNVGNTDSIENSSMPDMASFVNLFFNPSQIAPFDPSAKTNVVSEDWNGQTYQVITQSSQTQDPSGKTVTVSGKIYVGQDNLIHRVVIDASPMGRVELQLLNMKTGVPLTKADFAFTPPAWTKPAGAP